MSTFSPLKLLKALESIATSMPFVENVYHKVTEHYVLWGQKSPTSSIEAFQSSPCSYIFLKGPVDCEEISHYISQSSPDYVVCRLVEGSTQHIILLFPFSFFPLNGQVLFASLASILVPSADAVSIHFLGGNQGILTLRDPLHKVSLTHLVESLKSLGFLVDRTCALDHSDTILAVITTQDPITHIGPELQKVRTLLSQLISDSLFQNMEITSLCRLIIVKGLSVRQIDILRAQIAYLAQIPFSLSRNLMEESLLTYPELSGLCVNLFEMRFDPLLSENERAQKVQDCEQTLQNRLKNVTSIPADRLFQKLLQLIHAMVRTNYYQRLPQGEPKDYLSFKISPEKLSDLNPPIMMAEIFVFYSLVEGVHLRTSKVSRGGIRWSNRPEDYRTEILGLVKAQQVKNTLIVPSGAKGGFYLKDRLFSQRSREDQEQTARKGYRIFISGLLDLTDCQPKLSSPYQTYCYDSRDPYLVVAADKGTATFSDLANQISAEYQHWLGDAFASGGSQGYDHKKMGITAKGAFISASHHSRNLGISQNGTMVGIGDLSGDVFGNGSVLWPNLKLIAAFNHQHIFIDPNPTEKAYIERVRMTRLQKSSWLDFDHKAISEGGSIIDRFQKEIILSPQIQKLLQTESSSMSPDQLIKALLTLKVDILFNGGIGTYIKSSQERHIDVSDKTNDNIRVDSTQLRCKMIIEGGNMGVTQKGRVEFSQLGGKVNTDTLDNSAGVDCSDHEVNLKIFLDNLSDRGLFLIDRLTFLKKATDQVEACVLEHNLRQNQTISFMEYVAVRDRFLHQKILNKLTEKGILNLEVEGFPSNHELEERVQNGQGFSRPELIVLFAYVKMDLKKQLMGQESSKIFCTVPFLSMAFPSVAIEEYKNYLKDHPLAQEMAITHLINYCTQFTGIAFYYRLSQETQSPLVTLIQASLCAMDLFQIPMKIENIETMNNLTFAERYEGILQLYRLLFRCTKWLVLNTPTGFPNPKGLTERIARYLPQGLMTDPLSLTLQATQFFPALGLALHCDDQTCDLTLFQTFEKIRILFQAEKVEAKIEELSTRTAFEAQTRSWLREDFLKVLQSLSISKRLEKNFEVLKNQDFVQQWAQDVRAILQGKNADFHQLFVMIKFLEKFSKVFMEQ